MKFSTVILSAFVKIAVSQDARRPAGFGFDDYQYDAQEVFENEFESPQFTSGGFADLVSDIDYSVNEADFVDDSETFFSTAPFTVNNVITTTSEPRTMPELVITTTLAEMFQELPVITTTTSAPSPATIRSTSSTTTSTATTSTTSTTSTTQIPTTSTSTTTSTTSTTSTSTTTTLTTKSPTTTTTSTTSTTSTTTSEAIQKPEAFRESSENGAPQTGREVFSNREVASLSGNQQGVLRGGGSNNLPQCNVCSGSGSASSQTYDSCMAGINGITTCRVGEICGVEVRMRGGQVTQMSIRCMEENQCLRNMSQNFNGSPWRASCRPEPQLQSGRFGQSICNGCLKACGNGETCFDPRSPFDRAAGGTFTLDSLSRDDWTQGLTTIQV